MYSLWAGFMITGYLFGRASGITMFAGLVILFFNLWTLWRWVQRRRATGTVTACDKRGGWASPVVLEVMHAIVRDTPDAPTGELTRVYTRRVPLAHRVHRSSVLRALRRTGYVFKKPSAARGTGPARRPRQARRVPPVGHGGRSRAARVCG